MSLCIIYHMAPKYRERIFALMDREFDCDWYFAHTKTDIKEMDTSILKHVTFYPTTNRERKMFWKFNLLHLLFKREYQCFLIYAESRCLTDYLFIFLRLCFFPRKKLYLWTHGWYGKESYVETKLKLWMFRHVDGIFVYGNYAKRLMIEQGLCSDKIFVIYNSLFYEKQRAIRDKLHVSKIFFNHFQNENPILLFIGRLTDVKRIDMLLNSVAVLRDSGQMFNVVLVGDGEMREVLESIVAEKKLDRNVWFYGACYDEQIIAELIYNADLCVAPGNVGLTAMHAMVFGCPVVSHDDFKWQMPEFEAIRKGLTGDFFERGNLYSLAQVISNWFAANSVRRNEVRQACYKEIDTHWTPQVQLDVLKKYLKY